MMNISLTNDGKKKARKSKTAKNKTNIIYRCKKKYGNHLELTVFLSRQ